uniref:AlwI family type II restriction endonuclease n=1 Tax=Empedobacter sp. TaxID=1927715 RepID=UPI0028A871DD
MAKKKIKRIATYKQMAFETAVRNPERYKGILTAISPYINKVLNDGTLLQVVSSMYLNGIVSSDGVEITENSTIESIENAVIAVNSTRRADGGFPQGYQSRFWTYVRTLSEMGFVLAQYQQPLQFSEIALKLIHNKIDEQEAFSIQAMKYNRRSPYRNVSNDFNYFKFILEVLKQRERISYEQFIVSTFSNDGNVSEFLKIIDENTFGEPAEVEAFLRAEYETNLKAQTILRDYPDVVLRVLIITGFVSIQFRGKVFIYRNIANDDYINNLLSVNIELTNEEKENPSSHFAKLETYNNQLLEIVYKYREEVIEQDGFEYVQKVSEIIKLYELDEEKIVESIGYIGTSKNIIPAFRYIAEPLKLEFYLSLILALKYGKEFAIRPNYKADYIGLPISHAPGNTGDIEVYSKKLYWL